jgi:hypothetical protein
MTSIQLPMYVTSKSAYTGIVIYNQSICDAIIRAQDVMHDSPKLVVQVNKRKKLRVWWRTPTWRKKFETSENKGRSKSEAYQVRKQV